MPIQYRVRDSVELLLHCLVINGNTYIGSIVSSKEVLSIDMVLFLYVGNVDIVAF